MQLPESRVRMEAEALFGYGSAAASLRLLWRYRLLDVLLPQLAERFTKAKLPRCPCKPHLPPQSTPQLLWSYEKVIKPPISCYKGVLC